MVKYLFVSGGVKRSYHWTLSLINGAGLLFMGIMEGDLNNVNGFEIPIFFHILLGKYQKINYHHNRFKAIDA